MISRVLAPYEDIGSTVCSCWFHHGWWNHFIKVSRFLWIYLGLSITVHARITLALRLLFVVLFTDSLPRGGISQAVFSVI
jgi:hypothetical protein